IRRHRYGKGCLPIMIQVAIMGHGVVGCGVAELLQHNAAVIAGKAGEQLKIAKILDLRDFPELTYAELFTHRFEDIVENPEIQDNWISGFNLHTNKFVKQNNADENLS
ncbi:MAG: hypothetical protein U0M60_14685, partial [Clostridia bacterium]|nr:hypothetical protein [Clostridia bacterium]